MPAPGPARAVVSHDAVFCGACRCFARQSPKWQSGLLDDDESPDASSAAVAGCGTGCTEEESPGSLFRAVSRVGRPLARKRKLASAARGTEAGQGQLSPCGVRAVPGPDCTEEASLGEHFTRRGSWSAAPRHEKGNRQYDGLRGGEGPLCRTARCPCRLWPGRILADLPPRLSRS